MGRIVGLESHLEEAGRFYGSAVDLTRVRVKGSWLVLQGATAWTCNNVVRFKKAKGPQDVDLSTLIHELGHVWEHQGGQAQVLKGLVEQVGRLRDRDPYDYGGPRGARETRRLKDLSKESQAQILQEYWKSGRGDRADGRGNPFTPEYVADLRRLVEAAGIPSAAPARRGVVGWIDTAAGAIVNGFLGLFGW